MHRQHQLKSSHPDLDKILKLSHCELIQEANLMKINTLTNDDAVQIYHRYGRILSRECQNQVERIEINHAGETQYSFRPEYRLSFM